MSYFLLVGVHLLLIYRIQISLSLLLHRDAVADFYRARDVLLARNLFLIRDRPGFSANMDQFDLDFFAILMRAGDSPNLNTLLPNRARRHSLSLFY